MTAGADIGAVIFDKDGVLVDFERTWVPLVKELAWEFAGGDAARAARLLQAVGYDLANDACVPGSAWAAGTIAELARLWRPLSAGWSEAEMIARITTRGAGIPAHPLIDMADLRRRLEPLRARGRKMGVISNDSPASVRKMVAAFGLEDLFDFAAGADDVPRPKPAPDPVHAFAAATGVPPQRTVVIGDNVQDGEMARAAGCALFIGVLSGTSGHDELARLADHVAADALAALDWLGIPVDGPRPAL